MTFTAQNSAEGGTNGTAATPANTGSTSGTALSVITPATGGSITFSNTEAAHGSLSYKIISGTSGSSILDWSSAVLSTSPTTVWLECYFYLTAYPASTAEVIRAQTTGGARVGTIQITSAGKVRCVNAAAGTLSTSITTVPLNQWFRLEAKVTASTTAGVVEVKIFTSNLDNSTPDETNTNTSANTGSGVILAAVFGTSIAVSGWTFYIDDFGVTDIAYLGPQGSPPPPTALVLVNSAEAGSNGTIVTHANSGGGGTIDQPWDTVNIASGGALVFSNAQAVHGGLSYQITTPSGGGAVDLVWTSTSITTAPHTVWIRAYVYLTALPAATTQLINVATTSGARIGGVDITTAGNVRAINAAGGTVSTSTLTVPTGQWWRVEFKVFSSAAGGATEVKLFTVSGEDSVTPDETDTVSSGLATNGGAVLSVTFGTSISVANQNIFLDDLGLSDGAYLGPSGTNPPPPPPSVTLANTAAGGTNGTTVTPANSGSTSGNPFTEVQVGSGAGAIFSSAESAHGSLSYKFTTAGSAFSYVQWDGTVVDTAPTSIAVRAYIYLPSLPGGNLKVVQVFASGVPVGSIDISSAGKVLCRNAANGLVSTSVTVVPTGEWFRLECLMVSDPVVGQIEVKIYTTDMDDIIYNEINSNINQAMTGGGITDVLFGVVTALASATVYLDDIGVSELGYMGPTGVAPQEPIGWGINALTTIVPPVPGPNPTSVIAIPGATVLGYYSGGGNYAPDAAFEGVIGRPFRLLKFYCDCSVSSTGIPNTNAQISAAVAAGHYVHLSLNPVVYGGTTLATVGTQAPVTGIATHPWYGLDDLLAGDLDAVIDQWANSIKLIPTTCICDFWHEPDANAKIANPKTAPNLFPLACAYVINRFNLAGVTNVEWAWVMAGFQSNNALYASLWGVSGGVSPLDALITHLMWDPYVDGAGQNQTKFLNFYNEVQAGMLTPLAKSKYLGLAEWGVGQGGENRGTIFAACPAAFLGKLAIVEYFDSSVGAGYQNYEVAGTADTGSFTSMAADMQ